MRLAVIPARGGSKRIPRKNLRRFCGRPMIAWSIQAARASECFDRIVVSTDDPEIAEVANAEGAETPFVRPAHLSDDSTPTVPVVQHAINEISEQLVTPNEVCCIYATAPFVSAEDIRRGLKIMLATGSVFAMTVTSFSYPIQRALRIIQNGRVEMLEPEQVLTRSQNLEQTWHDAGQLYWGTFGGWVSGKPLIGPDTAAVPLPRKRVQDIDTPEDWEVAEVKFRVLKLMEAGASGTGLNDDKQAFDGLF